ncbi:MAG: hypothetical protein DMD76_02780 [Candidatus Rokuibacteriota bacterium]|nr:MAG: hypothetical protein DMD76_02780 [Candidatus Rokubacteria bacterium]
MALEPEVAHVDAMQRRLVGRAVVAAHPERAGLDQHDAVGARGRAWRRRAAKRDGDEGGDQVAGHTRHCIDSRPARGVLQRQPRGSRRPREDTAMRHRLRPSLVAVLVLVAIGLALAGLWPSAEAQAPIVLKLGTVNPGESPRNLAANEFARVAAEKSKGRIKVEVYTNNQLARGEGATLEGVQLGTIDVAPVGSAPIGGIFEPAYLPLDLPFLWTSRDQVWKVMDGPIGQELFKKMEAKGVKGLCFGGGWGFRNMLSNKRPINTPDDMKGQTIRVQESPIYVAMMKQLGANPVPMPWGEVYLAMKQGTVDGMEIPVVTMVSDKFFEVTKYYSLTKHTYPPISWFMNLKRYQSLPADLRQVVDEAGKAACALDRKSEVDKEKGELELIRKAGVQVNEVKDLKPFQDRMGPAYDVVTTKVGKEWMDRVTAAVKAAQ